MGEVKARVAKWSQRVHRSVINRLAFLGEQCVNHARDYGIGFYQDQTGNLRSSLGYAIYYNGALVTLKVDGDMPTGLETGQNVIETVAQNYPTGYVLIVVAGMSYAIHVESKGYNVLTMTEQFAETEAPKIMQALTKRITDADII